MKILWLSPDDMTTEVPISSLVGHDCTIHRYNRSNLPVDRGMLDRADQVQPDLILYIGSNDPLLMASIGTFLRLKGIAPTVLICHDASDRTWTSVLMEYQSRDAFSLIVNIDGNETWPKRACDFTALTPVPAQHYRNLRPLRERPIAFAFAGGYSSKSRREIVEHLARISGMVVPHRNESYGSYGDYAAFMQRCQIILNVPWSGSDNATQVKGRVLEAGHAGCVLLEHVDSAAQNWFKSGTDYAVYKSKEHAAQVVSDLLSDHDTMEWLANNLNDRVTTEHSALIFWSKVFKGVGLA